MKAPAIKTTALIWTCKAIASEAVKIFCGVAIIALDFNESPECLRYGNVTSAVGRSQVRRVNMCGRMSAMNEPPSGSGFTINSTAKTFSSVPLSEFLPNLVSITIQV
ncbi:hypothetical protein PSPO01_14860 [Paraphaeosphaeria sporulosa]